MNSVIKSYLTFPLITILFFGFVSGLPLALSASTLAVWLAESKVDIATIGLFAVVATPYTIKFLWSPVMDSLPVPLLTKLFGRRRSWILTTQIALIAALIFLGFARPDINPFITAIAALLVAFSSASQDIVIDAYRVEILVPEEQARGVAMAQLGYRIGMIASSAGALYLATYIGWQGTYFAFAAIMGIGIVTTLFAKRPLLQGALRPQFLPEKSPLRRRHEELLPVSTPLSFSDWVHTSVFEPFIDFTKREGWWMILIFIIVYKLADAFIGIVTNPFLIEIGFSKTDIANIVKIYGTIATLLGTFIGGSLVARFGTFKIMFAAGFLHALTNLLYVLQAHVGVNAVLLGLSVAMENLTGGISAAAFVAYLSGLCNLHYTATQYALLSSLSAFGRTWLATPAGYAAKYLGWQWFFALAALLALPGLVILWFMKRRAI